MSILYVLIPIALVLLGVAIWALFWAIRSGQFDDLDSQGWSVVLDDDSKPPSRNDSEKDEPGYLAEANPKDTPKGMRKENREVDPVHEREEEREDEREGGPDVGPRAEPGDRR